MSHSKTVKPSLSLRKPIEASDGSYIVVDREMLKTAARTLLGGVALAIILSLALQLAYPRSMALPQTRIGGTNYGFASKQTIASSIAAHHDQKMHIASGVLTLKHTPDELGIKLTSQQDAEQATRYSWRERLVPFSFVFERRELAHYGFTVDVAKAKAFAISLQKYNKSPVDAIVRLDGTRVVVDKQQDGYNYDANHLLKEIEGIELTSSMKVVLDPTVVPPTITDTAAAGVASVLQQRLQQPVTIKADGKSTVADPATVASWTVLLPNADNKQLQITYDKEKTKQWLAQFGNQVYRPGTPRTLTMTDGVTTSSADPADGLALNLEATADSIANALASGQTSVDATTTPVMVAAQVIRNYSRSSQGLQALLNYWDASNTGTWGIVLKQTDGDISANFNPNRQFVSASVYKLYIAYVTYTKADNGELNMSAPTSNGNTVSGCLDIMILRSDNACAEELGNAVGWSANNGMLHDKGFGSTSIAYGGQVTTAQDAASFLIQLQKGTLLSGTNQQALLDKMGRNIYRYAIPAGSPSIRSANKLGALGVYNHDVAIVYHPKGTYVLSVFSQGSSHARIRELARQVSLVMSQ